MKKISLIFAFVLLCCAQISYCLSPEQCKFMASKSLIELSALAAIQKIYVHCHGSRTAIETCIRNNDVNIPVDLLPLLAKYWFLLYGDAAESYCSVGRFVAPELEYSYSIEELHVFNKLPSIQDWDDDTLLNLSRLRIEDLNGLRAIPGIAGVTWLVLWNNRLKALQPEIFKGLHCKHIDLSSNRFKKLDPAAFKGLANLGILELQENQCSEEAFEDFKAKILALYPSLDIFFDSIKI